MHRALRLKTDKLAFLLTDGTSKRGIGIRGRFEELKPDCLLQQLALGGN